MRIPTVPITQFAQIVAIRSVFSNWVTYGGSSGEIRHSEFPRYKEAKIAKTTRHPQHLRLVVAQLARDTGLLKFAHDSMSHWQPGLGVGCLVTGNALKYVL